MSKVFYTIFYMSSEIFDWF